MIRGPYKASNIFGLQNYVDGRKDENELLQKSSNWNKMAGRAKAFVRNMPFANAIKNTMEVYCGCLTPVKGNEESRKAFAEWAENAGMESGQSLAELTAQLIGVLTWADCLVVLATNPYSAPGTISACVKLIDPLQVETPPKYKDKGLIGGKRVVLGVVLDKNDIELGYYVRKAGTDGQNDLDYDFVPRYTKDGRFYSMLVRAPGSRFPGQVRSFPMLSASMNTIDILDQLSDSVAKSAFAKSVLAVLLETAHPAEPDDKEFVTEKDNEELEETQKQKNNVPSVSFKDGEAGDLYPIPEGTTPHIINSSGDVNAVEQIKQQIKIIAGSLGIPYAVLMSDFEKINFSAGKLMLSKLFLLVDLWNYGPLKRLYSELYKWVCFEYYLLKGKVPTPELLKCLWIGPKQPDPDPVKSANADKIRLSCGVKNRSDIVAENSGDDYESHVEQKAQDDKVEKDKLGYTFDEHFGKASPEVSADDTADTGDDEE